MSAAWGRTELGEARGSGPGGEAQAGPPPQGGLGGVREAFGVMGGTARGRREVPFLLVTSEKLKLS